MKAGIESFLKGLNSGQKRFGESIAVIVNSTLLSIVYFMGIGLTALFAKIVKKRFLDLKIDKDCETYWSDLSLTKRSLEECYRQF
jgi:hypothetical protein